MGRAELTAVLRGLGDIAVAVSGGVDSMTLAVLAHRDPEVRAEVFHAVSPAVPPEATARVHKYAGREHWDLRIIDAGEFHDPEYLRNPVTRCFHCKSNLYNAIASATTSRIVSGTNTDDLGDYRPGLAAADSRDVCHPYVEASVDKRGVRAIAQAFGLDDIASLPAAPCLASRVETGLAIESQALNLLHEVERALTETLGPKAVRCRVRAGRVVVELDEETLRDLDDVSRQRIVDDVAERWRRGGRPQPVELAPYRRGSAFVHSP
jgi:uncharacterized protein